MTREVLEQVIEEDQEERTEETQDQEHAMEKVQEQVTEEEIEVTENVIVITQNEKEVADKSANICDLCGKIFKTKRIRNQHKKTIHSSDPEVKKRMADLSAKKALLIQCPLCDSKYNSRNLNNHIKKDHPTHQLVEECDVCKKQFSNGSHLSRHMFEVHSEQPRFQCPVCDFTSKHGTNLTKHMIIHQNSVLLSCENENCDFSTKRVKELKSHKCRMKTFVCDLCNKKCATSEALRKHKGRNHK